MAKATISIMILVLLLATSTPADITQNQNAQIGMDNIVLLPEGALGAEGTQNVLLHGNQEAEGAASQSLIGSVGQVGQAFGNGGLIGMMQTSSGSGLQNQVLGSPYSSLNTLGLLTMQGLLRLQSPLGGLLGGGITVNSGLPVGNLPGTTGLLGLGHPMLLSTMGAGNMLALLTVRNMTGL